MKIMILVAAAALILGTIEFLKVQITMKKCKNE